MRKTQQENLVIGERIRSARKLAGYTQEQLAELVGITPQYLSDLERGAVGTSVQTLIFLSDNLSVSVDYLLNRHKSPVEEDNNEHLEFTEAMKNLSSEQRKIMYQSINLMLKAFETE